MICPSCGYENIQGQDTCENCGADLRTSDVPYPASEFEARLVAETLSALDPGRPLILPPDAGAAEAIRQMQDGGVECVLVSDGDRLVGIFTERDALLKLAGRQLDGIRLGEVMTPDPVVLRGQDPMAVAIHKMAVGGFRHIPVVDGGKVTGVVSARDIFRHVIGLLDQRGA